MRLPETALIARLLAILVMTFAVLYAPFRVESFTVSVREWGFLFEGPTSVKNAMAATQAMRGMIGDLARFMPANPMAGAFSVSIDWLAYLLQLLVASLIAGLLFRAGGALRALPSVAPPIEPSAPSTPRQANTETTMEGATGRAALVISRARTFMARLLEPDGRGLPVARSHMLGFFVSGLAMLLGGGQLISAHTRLTYAIGSDTAGWFNAFLGPALCLFGLTQTVLVALTLYFDRNSREVNRGS